VFYVTFLLFARHISTASKPFLEIKYFNETILGIVLWKAMLTSSSSTIRIIGEVLASEFG
jgi:hypothetical protein